MAQHLESEFVELGKLFSKFQLIELCLKMLITKAKFKKSALRGQHDEIHSTLDLEYMSLGDSLNEVKKFKLIKHELLVERLAALKKDRNFIAHKGFLMVSSMPSKKFFLGHETNPLDYQRLNIELDEVIGILMNEFNESSLAF